MDVFAIRSLSSVTINSKVTWMFGGSSPRFSLSR